MTLKTGERWLLRWGSLCRHERQAGLGATQLSLKDPKQPIWRQEQKQGAEEQLQQESEEETNWAGLYYAELLCYQSLMFHFFCICGGSPVGKTIVAFFNTLSVQGSEI